MPRLDYPALMPTIRQPNLRGPFYDDGALTVSFVYPSLPHHDPFRTDPFIVGVPEAGTFTVEWKIGAKNLSLPETGTLTLEVLHDIPDAEPITTLDALLALGGTRPSDREGETGD